MNKRYKKELIEFSYSKWVIRIRYLNRVKHIRVIRINYSNRVKHVRVNWILVIQFELIEFSYSRRVKSNLVIRKELINLS